MDNRRRYRGDQQIQGPRSSYNRKPHQGRWQRSVPWWEKKFCAEVGSVPWRKLLEAKKYMYLYGNVVNWNDSACEEAFHNAKKRFWAAFNGLPCDIPLPNPDIYIDEIDWDSTIDPELLLDLEREPNVPNEVNKDENNGVILDTSMLLNQPYTVGWGEAEERKDTNFPSGPDNRYWQSNYDPRYRMVVNGGWGYDWNEWDYYCHQTMNHYAAMNSWEWGRFVENNGKPEHFGWHMPPRNNASRFQNQRWRNDARWQRKDSFTENKPPTTQWNQLAMM